MKRREEKRKLLFSKTTHTTINYAECPKEPTNTLALKQFRKASSPYKKKSKEVF
jgi:hypothetical protein